jgi:uncharacterized repeat protein (TIGR03806 family)
MNVVNTSLLIAAIAALGVEALATSAPAADAVRVGNRAAADGAEPAAYYGLSSVRQTGACLRMPGSAKGSLPRLLSQTGAFADAAHLLPAEGLLPYDIIFPFWSDGAQKSRWMAPPAEGKIGFSATGEWTFPKGTVFVKHFELPTDESRPEVRRRLETRLLVCDDEGGVYGASYKWRSDGSDADLLTSNLLEAIVVRTAAGVRTQNWYYPSRQDCLVCHTRNAGLVLGVKTRQMNRDHRFPSGKTDNQLRAWNSLGLFASNLEESALAACPKLVRPDDTSRSLEDRARSYLDANCAHCHRPGGTVAFFDARYDAPASRQNLVDCPVLLDEGIDGARAIAPKDIWRSILFLRVTSMDALKMPPLAHEVADQTGASLLGQWIESMPGQSVLPPPLIAPSGGDFSRPVTVRLREVEPGAVIRYTLDGSKPTSSDPVYGPEIRLTNSATIRARAFKPGYTRSITAQETFIIGQSP